MNIYITNEFVPIVSVPLSQLYQDIMKQKVSLIYQRINGLKQYIMPWVKFSKNAISSHEALTPPLKKEKERTLIHLVTGSLQIGFVSIAYLAYSQYKNWFCRSGALMIQLSPKLFIPCDRCKKFPVSSQVTFLLLFYLLKKVYNHDIKLLHKNYFTSDNKLTTY